MTGELNYVRTPHMFNLQVYKIMFEYETGKISLVSSI